MTAAWMVLAWGGRAPAQVPQVAERVEVSRVVIDVHVLKDDGSPVTGLTTSDLRVLVDGHPVKTESVRWTTEAVALRTMPATPPAIGAAAVARAGMPYGRQIVLLFQKDLEPSRVEGLMAMLRRAEAFLDGLDPADRVAVASFDYHLELWSDFTTDRAAVRAILERSVLFAGRAPEGSPGEQPALLPAFDRVEGRRASSMEEALLRLGNTLDAMPGSKAMVIFGYGFGRILGAGDLRTMAVGLDQDYAEARRVLARARVTVYCLDLTQADSHTLEAGLMKVAEDTGGFYLRTHEFPGQAMSRLATALRGHYEVSVEKPDLPRGEHVIRVELIGRKGVVLARRTYVG
jgi:VWFA-related protein